MEGKEFKKVIDERFAYHQKNQTDTIKAIEKLTDAVTKLNWNMGRLVAVAEKNPELAKKITDAQEEEV